MGKPEFSSSEPYLPPKTLAERLKAQANGLAEIEAASFMAERFAPDLQTPAANDEEEDNSPSEPMAEPVIAVERLTAERKLTDRVNEAPSDNRGDRRCEDVSCPCKRPLAA